MNKILVWLAGIGGILVLFLRGQLYKEKAESKERDLEVEKAANKASQEATEAMVKGVTNEGITNTNRDHFSK